MSSAAATSTVAAAQLPLVVIMTPLKKSALQSLAAAGFRLEVTASPQHAISQVVLDTMPAALVIDLAHADHRAAGLLRTLQRKQALPAHILLVSPAQPSAEITHLALRYRAELCPDGFDQAHLAAKLHEGLGL